MLFRMKLILLIFVGYLSVFLILTFTYNEKQYFIDRHRLQRNQSIRDLINRSRYCYNEKAIIFLQLSNIWRWNPFEACSIKLAAIHNPEIGVCVLSINYPIRSHPILRSIRNVEYAKLDIDAIFADTPIQKWYKNLAKPIIDHPMNTLSNALRLAYLYKYGGKYMDIDVWTLRNLAVFSNVAGWQDDRRVNNAVLCFQKRHPFVKAALDNFRQNHNRGWGSVGPLLVTRIHKSALVDNRTYEILPPRVFYPTSYNRYSYPFRPLKKTTLLEMINGSYTLHLWGKYVRKFYDEPPPNGSYVADMLDTVCSTSV